MRVLYIDIDSLRADHLGCYGYPRPTSPVIDEIAARGMHAARCHTSDSPCAPSRAALFSGRFGINNGIVTHNGPAATLRYPGINGSEDMRKPMFMRLLQRYGWETVSFSGYAQRHTAWWYGAGFTQNFSCSMPGGHESADQVAAKVSHWLQANGTRDEWFMHVTLWDVHTPYYPPAPLIERMRALDPAAAPSRAHVERDMDRWWGSHTPLYWWASDGGHNDKSRPQTAAMPDNIESFEDYLDFLACYDATIAYADEYIGHLLTELDRLGVLEETAVIVSADHGESVGDLGMYFEHLNAGNGTSHVPFVMAWPGKTDGVGEVDELCYQLDIAATVTDLAGYPLPAEWDSRSLAPHFDGSIDRDHLVVGTGLGSYQRAVVTRDHRLIRTIHPGMKNYDPLYLFGSADAYRDELDLQEHRQTVCELDHLLVEWQQRHTAWPRYSADPFAIEAAAGRAPGMGSHEALVRRMEELGRTDHLADLLAREALTNPERDTWDSTYESENNPDAQEIRV